MSEPQPRALGRLAGVERDLDLVVVGEINPDIVVRAADPTPVFGQVERWVDTIDLVIGSSSVITACGAARLGLRTAFVGLVGDDPLGRFMVAEMSAHGIDVAAVDVRAGVPTGATVVLSAPDDRAILTSPGTIPLLRLADIPAAILERTRHLHVGSPFLVDGLRPDLPTLLAAAHRAGASTSVDPNWDPRGDWDGGLAAALQETDVFMPNATEASRLTGIDEPGGAARALLEHGPRMVAVKLGPAGALAVSAEGDAHRAPALPVEVRDTTGAGDSFDAGFLAGWIGGRDLRDSLLLAVACGSLSTRAAGGVAGQPTLAEAEAAVAGASWGTEGSDRPEEGGARTKTDRARGVR